MCRAAAIWLCPWIEDSDIADINVNAAAKRFFSDTFRINREGITKRRDEGGRGSRGLLLAAVDLACSALGLPDGAGRLRPVGSLLCHCVTVSLSQCAPSRKERINGQTRLDC
jgi:hypothetical protein